MLGFTLTISVLAALAFGLAPLRAALRVPLAAALKSGAATAQQAGERRRGGQAVVALQVALCLVLLVGAGLLVRTLRNLDAEKLGLRDSGLLVFGINPPPSGLFGLQPGDPATFAGAIVGLRAVVAAASWVPALRAASVDPIVAVRSE